MSGIFTNDNLSIFFQRMLEVDGSIDEAFGQVRLAVEDIAMDCNIGRVEAYMQAEESMLRPHGANDCRVIYEANQYFLKNPYIENIISPDGGHSKFIFYPKRHVFTECEYQVVEYISKQMSIIMSRIVMRGILNNVLVTDLSSGIPNLAGFMNHVGMLIAKGTLSKYEAMYFNVKNFKYVNKEFSYMHGDIVMKQYARKIQSLLSGEEYLARLGGDNYVAIVQKEHVQDFVKRIQTCSLTYTDGTKRREFTFSATVGIAELEDIHEPGQVMQRISVAFQVAKTQSHNGTAVFTKEIYKEVMNEKEILAHFHAAMRNHEFVVYYQPKVDVKKDKLCGAEALVRWVQNGKVIPPMKFIPVLERDGSICQLDFYVLEMVCQAIQKWDKAGFEPIRISSNFSRRHLGNPHLVEEIVAIIDKYHVSHEYIEIELTESENFNDYKVLTKLVSDLKEQGISASIDDFGTGYSSLNMLKDTNFDIVKIDKSFIPMEYDYAQKQKDKMMFAEIVKMVKNLGMETIAEGIESKEQLDYLVEVGCDIVQGYLIDKPLPEKEFAARRNHYGR